MYYSHNSQNAWHFAFYCALVFVVGYILNEIITRIYLNGEIAYFKVQICWNKNQNALCFKNIFMHFYYVIFSNLIVYGLGYFVGFCLLLIAFFKYASFHKLPILCVLFLLEMAPFILTFYSGEVDQALRSQLTLPFVIAANCGLALYYLPQKSLAKMLAILAVVAIFLQQMHSVFRLQYAENLRFQNDILLAMRIEMELAQNNWEPSKPVVFVGSVAPRLNSVSAIGHYVGLPISQFGRMHDFMQSMGFPIVDGNHQQKEIAWKHSPKMKTFPQKGFVENLGDFYAIKLGEPIVSPE